MAAVGGDADAERAVLTDALLRLPRHPRRFERELFLMTIDAQPDAEAWQQYSPVAGVGVDLNDDSLVVFTQEMGVVDIDAIANRFELKRHVREIYTGPIRPARRHRPAQGGDSVSGAGLGGDTGTICCLVQDGQGDEFVLGCNHTLAGVNQSSVNFDVVLQPGELDGGASPGDDIGVLSNFMTITLGGYHPNVMDAAIAEVANQGDVERGIRGRGRITGVAAPLAHNERVEKFGARTGHTTGTYRYTVNFTPDLHGTPALFVAHYGVESDDPAGGFAAQGDSGAPVLPEGESDLVGMVIAVAAASNLTLVTPIDPILNHFGIEPVL